MFFMLLNLWIWISQQELSDPPALDPTFYKKLMKCNPKMEIQVQSSDHVLLKGNSRGHQELSSGRMNQLDVRTGRHAELSNQESPASMFASASFLHRNSPDEANITANASAHLVMLGF